MNHFKNYLSYSTCFLTGAATLVIELVSFRVLAPQFGTSSYVTGIIINTVLLALAFGYYAGGFLADKYKNLKLPYLLILATTVYLFIIYLVYPGVLESLGRLNVISGSIISIFIMFFLPMSALAFIPTYLIRALVKENNIGLTAGRIYSISTLGSIAGGITATFVLIPYLGSSRSFLASIILLLILSIAGLIYYSKYFLLLFLTLPVLFFFHPVFSKDYIYSTESQYNIIKVKKEDNELYLYLNNYFGFHSKSLNKDNLSDSYYDYFLLGPMISQGNEILILGNGAGTAFTELSTFFDVKIDCVEIDKKMTQTGMNYFNLKFNDKSAIIYNDARVFLKRSLKKYDIIIIDLYSGSAHIPFHLATTEFFKSVNDSLKESGVVLVNIPNYSIGTILGEYYINTIKKEFNTSFIADHILFAFKKNISKNQIFERLNPFIDHKILGKLVSRSMSSLQECGSEVTEKIFTDDSSQIEKLTFSVINQ